MKQSVMLSWIGSNDLSGMKDGAAPKGPIVSSLLNAGYSAAELLSNYPIEETELYIEGLKKNFPEMEIRWRSVGLSSPTEYREIFPKVEAFLDYVTGRYSSEKLIVNLSPGTPTMAAVWILLTKTRFPVAYVESYVDKKSDRTIVKSVELPFSLSVELSQKAKTRLSNRYTQAALAEVGENTDFGKIFGESELMLIAKRKARRLAELDVPTLIVGETGTGKELFTKAIISESSRSNEPLKTVNCGAIPSELIDSILFGHTKGAFTGAIEASAGVFRDADGGTVFLDEIGELPLEAQVRLLRVLQEGEVTPVGSSKSIKVNVRVIAATHRDLVKMVSEGSFRSDLFYRLAVGVLELPPLRNRTGEIGEFADQLMKEINEELGDQPNYESKKISPEVKNIILRRRWPGNVRELKATLVRAAIWSESDSITADEFEESSIKEGIDGSSEHSCSLEQPIDIQELMGDVARKYIPIAMQKCAGNKTKAATLIGLNNQQTLTKWIEKYQIKI